MLNSPTLPTLNAHPLLRPSTTAAFSFNSPPTTTLYTLSLHDALPISGAVDATRESDERPDARSEPRTDRRQRPRSEEHTSELQSRPHLVCRLLLEKKKR